MKVLIATFALLIGIILGWFIHRGAEIEEHCSLPKSISKEGLNEIRLEAIGKVEEMMEEEDRLATAFALVGLTMIENEKIDRSKEYFAEQIASFYINHVPPVRPEKSMSDTTIQLLNRIEEKIEEFPVLKNAVEKSLREYEESVTAKGDIEAQDRPSSGRRRTRR